MIVSAVASARASRSRTAGKLYRALLAAVTLGALSACSSVPDAPSGEDAYAAIPAAQAVGVDHVIAPDDVLKIDIYREPDLSLQDAAVDAKGAIRLPLVGDVSVGGLTAHEAADVIAGRLGERYLVAPQVTVFVKSSPSRRFTIDGEVREAGVFPVDGRIGLMQAVAMAKGATRIASLSQIVVIRRVDGQRQAAKFDLNAIRAGTAPDPDVREGDVILVGLSHAKAALYGLLSAAPLLTTAFIAVDGN